MPKNRKKQAKPVSLAPLSPEEALAGLMRVKPEKGEPMPKFKHGDKVKVVEGQYAGQTGVIWGAPNQMSFTSPQTTGDGQAIGGRNKHCTNTK